MCSQEKNSKNTPHENKYKKTCCYENALVIEEKHVFSLIFIGCFHEDFFFHTLKFANIYIIEV